MESIQNGIETALAKSPLVVRVCLVVLATAVTAMLAMDAGESLGKALYYFTH
ncbi:hypothetical protein [Rhodanobacter glycinis]|uniref:Uncharacterized protein n=1 Tax=Rhodanobacter glycinis TaxID=582702 RepID=A0A1I4AWL3_9GAMM|nr:hypothetical protein [Rhodanobacter glycinis]SFK60261.1 hypothetical protein SAMN05192579_104147 [Rhodanobacter glycinis]